MYKYLRSFFFAALTSIILLAQQIHANASDKPCFDFCDRGNSIVVHRRGVVSGRVGVGSGVSSPVRSSTRGEAGRVSPEAVLGGEPLLGASVVKGAFARSGRRTGPVTTPPVVLEAWRKLTLPIPQLCVQPAHIALVNKAEIAYTTTTRDHVWHLALLGEQITIRTHTSSYIWTWGDGHTSTTTNPGKPYPHQTVTHTYHTPGTYHLTVTTITHATWQTPTHPPQPIPEPLTLTSPTQQLTLTEKHTTLINGN